MVEEINGMIIGSIASFAKMQMVSINFFFLLNDFTNAELYTDQTSI